MTGDEAVSRIVPPAEPAESFVARWSRRKSLAGDAERGTGRPDVGGPEEADEQATPGRESPAVFKTDADMPPVESLDADSDYAQFLSPEVSERLQQAALRKLFRQPHFNVTDGLCDYAGDYRDFTPLGAVVTSDMRHHLEMMAKEKLAGPNPEEGSSSGPGPDESADARTQNRVKAPGTSPIGGSASPRQLESDSGRAAASVRRGHRAATKGRSHG